MKQIIVESAYDDERLDRPEYYVARYKYDSTDEQIEDKDSHHRGWGKTEEEAEYNLLLQRNMKQIKPKNENDFKNVMNEIYSLLSFIFYLLSFIFFNCMILKDFGTISSLEWLIMGLFSIFLIIYWKKTEESLDDNVDDEDY